MNRNLVATILSASLIMVTDQALSSVVESGVETTVRHYVVLGAESTVTYHPGVVMVVMNQPPVIFHFVPDSESAATNNPGQPVTGDSSGNGFSGPETRNVSGSFDAEFSRYWWKYDLGGTGHSAVLSEQYGLRLLNANLTGGADWTELPLFGFSMVSGGGSYASFSGYSSPCPLFPVGPNDHCSGFSLGPISSASGGLLDGKMTLNGVIHLGTDNSYYSYDLVASPVPIPSSIWLFGSLMAGVTFLRKG
ncbi:MAG TPA: hypothetical protein PKC34_08795 [Pseudomonadales bacterium]|nr:hypothetical protein [Pseudomonadales bacterium]HMW15626.1 hypothetical protein [Pseudomonadales bacterium]